MAIQQRNLYLPAQNLSNLSVNVDDNRLGNDQTEISVNFGTTPATITVKLGSVIEVNGNSYVIDTADETFQMANATDSYITFTDNPSTLFSSAPTEGIYDSQKQGFYQTGNTVRTLKWYVDQTTQSYSPIMNQTVVFDHCRSEMNATQAIGAGGAYTIVNFDTVKHDTRQGFNVSSKNYTIVDSGFYMISSTLFGAGGSSLLFFNAIYVNGVQVADALGTINVSSPVICRTLPLKQGDVVDIRTQSSVGFSVIAVDRSSFQIDRLF